MRFVRATTAVLIVVAFGLLPTLTQEGAQEAPQDAVQEVTPTPQNSEEQESEPQDEPPEDEADPPETEPEAPRDNTRVIIERDDTSIRITNFGRAAEGARSILNNPNCTEEARTDILYAPDEFVETLTEDSRLTSTVAVIVREEAAEGEEQTETLELYGSTIEFNRPGCIETEERDEGQVVRLEQGRTTVLGSHFFLDQGTDIGVMQGPVSLERVAEGDSPALSATSDSLEANLETDTQILRDNVRIESDGRVSEADSVDFDEENSIAILRGNPATSRKDDELFEGNEITYFLDSNDVRVVGNIRGELEIDDLNTGAAPSENAPEDDFVPEDEFPDDEPEDEFSSDF